MAEGSDRAEEESRFDLQQLLNDVQAETVRQTQGPVAQTDILKMFQKRKPRDDEG